MTLSPAKTTKFIGRGQQKSSRKEERGVTIFIVAAGMVSLLAMAVLAIAAVTLYVASRQAHQAAHAAALGGAAGVSWARLHFAPGVVAPGSVWDGRTGLGEMG